MATYTYTLLFLTTFWHSISAQPFVRDYSSTPQRFVHVVVDKRPEFPGGTATLLRYLQKNSDHTVARNGDVESNVFLNFIVSETGALEEIRVLKGVSPGIDTEALSLVQAMPKWIPAQKDGHAVACRFYLPIRFFVPNTTSYKAILLRIIN